MGHETYRTAGLSNDHRSILLSFSSYITDFINISNISSISLLLLQTHHIPYPYLMTDPVPSNKLHCKGHFLLKK